MKLTIDAPEVKTIPVNLPLKNPKTGETGTLLALAFEYALLLIYWALCRASSWTGEAKEA